MSTIVSVIAIIAIGYILGSIPTTQIGMHLVKRINPLLTVR
jgi:glycerol-3-phosphate acyltransferase PlsY